MISLQGRVTLLLQEKQQLADRAVRLTEAGAKREQELSDKIISLEAVIQGAVVALPRPNPIPAVPTSTSTTTADPTPVKKKGQPNIDLSPHREVVSNLRKSFDRMKTSTRVELETMQSVLSDTKRYECMNSMYVCMYICMYVYCICTNVYMHKYIL